MNYEGAVFLKSLPVVRQVFDRAGVEYFDHWHFRTTSWHSRALDDAFFVSTERQNHTLLVRVPSAQRCPLFEVMLMNASSDCAHYGPMVQSSVPRLSEKAKGKCRAYD